MSLSALHTVHEGIVAPPVFGPVLERLSAEAAEHFGTASARLIPTSYEDRPFSHLMCVRVSRREDEGPDSYIFIKIFKPKPLESGAHKMRERVAHDFRTTRRIYESMSHRSDLGAVRPIACYEEHLALVTERAEGRTLLDHLETHASWFPSADTRAHLEGTLTAVGRWLQVFQNVDRGEGHVSIDSLSHYVDLRLKRLVQHAAGFTEEDRQRVLDHLARLGRLASPTDLEEVPIHADVAFGNILVSGPRVVLLDFAMAARGSVLHDASRLHMQLDLLLAKPRFRPHVIHGLQRALLRGLDPSLSPEKPFFRFLLLLHRINHLATVTVGHHPFPGSAFNRLVRRRHRRWIDREIARQ